MCLGVPLQVITVHAGYARCAPSSNPKQVREINTNLLDHPPKAGDWLLAHIDLAIRPLAATEARQIEDALEAVLAAAAGLPFEHLLGDLADREPQLPEHLRAQASNNGKTSHA